jgi:two-component system, OmpR family, response regulator ResD
MQRTKRVLIIAAHPDHQEEIRARLGEDYEVTFVADPANRVLESGKIRLALDNLQAQVGGASLELTGIEVRLLSLFLRNPDRVLSRAEILEAVWGERVFVLGRTIDKHICALRKKLKTEGQRIETVEGVGYRLITPVRTHGGAKAA